MIQFEIINYGMKISDVIGDGVENVHLVPILAFGSLSAVCTRLRAFNCLPEGELSSSVCAFHQELRLGLEIRESGLSGAPVPCWFCETAEIILTVVSRLGFRLRESTALLLLNQLVHLLEF